MTPECIHERTKFLDEEWPTGEAIELCLGCAKSRAHWEQGESPWTMIEDLDAERAALQKELDAMRQISEQHHGDAMDDAYGPIE